MSLETNRQPGLTSHSDVPRPPFGGKRRLVQVVPVRFAGAFATHDFDCGSLVLRPGDRVVAVTSKGPMIGKVTGLPHRAVVPAHETARVLRKADDGDLRRWEEIEAERDRVHRAGVRALRKLRTALKIVSVEIPLDRSRVILFYSSEERVDVRPLVRMLSKEVDGRLDARQVGIRDGTGVIGGIGPCGNEVCCSSFLTDFSSISIRFAKDQGLSLNPQRIMGMCGRLKCCLVYEQSVYKELKKYAPRRRTGVVTPRGAGNVLEVDVLARKVKVGLHHAVETFHLRDVVVLDRSLSPQEIAEGGLSKEESVLEARRQRRGGTSDSRGGMSRQAASVLQEEYLWDDMAGDTTISDAPADAGGGSKRSRRRRSGGGSDGGGSGGSKGGGNRKRRSSRRRKGGGGGGQGGGGGGQGGGKSGGSNQQQASGSPSKNAEGGGSSRRRRRRRRGKGGGGGQGGGSSSGQGGGGASGGSGGGSGGGAG